MGINARPYLVTRRRADRGAASRYAVLPRGLFLSREFPRLADSKLMPDSFLEGEKLCSPVIHMNPVLSYPYQARIHTNQEITDDKR